MTDKNKAVASDTDVIHKDKAVLDRFDEEFVEIHRVLGHDENLALLKQIRAFLLKELQQCRREIAEDCIKIMCDNVWYESERVEQGQINAFNIIKSKYQESEG